MVTLSGTHKGQLAGSQFNYLHVGMCEGRMYEGALYQRLNQAADLLERRKSSLQLDLFSGDRSATVEELIAATQPVASHLEVYETLSGLFFVLPVDASGTLLQPSARLLPSVAHQEHDEYELKLDEVVELVEQAQVLSGLELRKKLDEAAMHPVQYLSREGLPIKIQPLKARLGEFNLGNNFSLDDIEIIPSDNWYGRTQPVVYRTHASMQVVLGSAVAHFSYDISVNEQDPAEIVHLKMGYSLREGRQTIASFDLKMYNGRVEAQVTKKFDGFHDCPAIVFKFTGAGAFVNGGATLGQTPKVSDMENFVFDLKERRQYHAHDQTGLDVNCAAVLIDGMQNGKQVDYSATMQSFHNAATNPSREALESFSILKFH